MQYLSYINNNSNNNNVLIEYTMSCIYYKAFNIEI